MSEPKKDDLKKEFYLTHDEKVEISFRRQAYQLAKYQLTMALQSIESDIHFYIDEVIKKRLNIPPSVMVDVDIQRGKLTASEAELTTAREEKKDG